MAYPVILVDSATGSDSLASGSGPSTAITGSNGSTSVDGLTVTLDGSPSLSGVATDGSHVIFVGDATAGRRNFASITGKDDSAKTVTVAEAFTGSVTGLSWAIGGKRASIGSSSSKRLFDNNGAAGDAMPGWTVEMQSGHSETISATYDLRRAGTTTEGPITLRGASGAATLPLVTFSNNGNGFVPRGAGLRFVDFEVQNSNATKTSSVAIVSGSASVLVAERIKIADATNNFWKGVVCSQPNWQIISCEIAETANLGVELSGVNFLVLNNYIHDCGDSGMSFSVQGVVVGNIFARNAEKGMVSSLSGGSAQTCVIAHNTFDDNVSSGAEFASDTVRAFGVNWINNIFSNNGGYGLNYSGASVTDILFLFHQTLLKGNNFYGNTSGATNPASITANEDSSSVNPDYTNASGGDFSVGTAIAGKGFPIGGVLPVGGYSETESYVDPGASQRQEAGGGGGSYSPIDNILIG